MCSVRLSWPAEAPGEGGSRTVGQTVRHYFSLVGDGVVSLGGFPESATARPGVYVEGGETVSG